MAAADHPVTGSLKISLNHPHTSANVEMISFLYDGAKISVDGSIAISKYLHHVHGRLLERSIILGKNTSITTLPKLTVASYDVTAAHGASIDTLDQQKLFYMMSRGLSQQQSQTLLVD
ncbi:MAG: SufD family Fe-S cluster assembly protein [bacterium]